MISYYLSVFSDYMSDRHPTLTIDNYNELIDFVEEVQDNYTYDEYCEQIDAHFANLPDTNNGSIVAFVKAKTRYFGI